MEYLTHLNDKYQNILLKKINLDMTRGNPCPEQLELSSKMLNIITSDDLITENYDYRNYGKPDILGGIPEIKKLFSELFSLDYDEMIIAGNSSLNLMFDTILKCMVYKLPSAKQSWNEEAIEKKQKIKFLCPSPGYDRHFAVCESLDIEMIPVKLTGNGVDIAEIQELLSADDMIKGMWCVPQFSNPTGEIYSDEVVKALGNLEVCSSFRIFWDNAYSVHYLTDEKPKVYNFMKTLNPETFFMFASTSKITFAGAGVAGVFSTKSNTEWIKLILSKQTIGYDKINQLRHAKFLNSLDDLETHMNKHKEILFPKFKIVDKILTENLGTNGEYATWSKPIGGYFINLDVKNDCAKKIVAMCKNAGLNLTKAGTTFPYGFDKDDKNIRLAVSYANLNDLKIATDVLCTIIKVVVLSKI